MNGSVIEAVVQVGEQETPYLRCGRGAPVVVLATSTAERERLVRLVGTRFRVVAPQPPGTTDLSAWLREVIEGLGLEDPILVTAAEWTHEVAGEVVRSDGDDAGLLRRLEALTQA